MAHKFLSDLFRNIRNESGSISIFISGLFLIIFTISLGIIDISDSYLAKRELIQIGEDAILVASHSIDESRYYSGAQIFGGESTERVPLDCVEAAVKFTREVSLKNLRKNSISVSGWSCNSDQITASITSNIKAIVSFPILSNIIGGQIGINATLGSTSEMVGN